jgi:hypothetical protein
MRKILTANPSAIYPHKSFHGVDLERFHFFYRVERIVILSKAKNPRIFLAQLIYTIAENALSPPHKSLS